MTTASWNSCNNYIRSGYTASAASKSVAKKKEEEEKSLREILALNYAPGAAASGTAAPGA